MAFFKSKSFLGVDVGAGGIKIVELKKEKNRPVLFTYGLTSDPQDVHRLLVPKQTAPADGLVAKALDGNKEILSKFSGEVSDEQVEKYAEVIKAVCKASRTSSKIATVSLPASAIFHAVVNLPQVDKKDLNSIVMAEIKKLLPRPIEEMAVDYQVVASDPTAKIQKVLVNAVPHVLVSFYSRVFQRAGLVLNALESEGAALERALVGKDKAVTMVIDIGAERTNFFIIDQSVPLTYNTLESGGNKMNRIIQKVLGLEDGFVEQIKYDLSNFLPKYTEGLPMEKVINLFMPVIDPIVKEIEYSFNLYLRQTGNEGKQPEKIILTGGAAMLPYLSQYISDRFKIKCYIGDPWARIVYQDGLKTVLNQIGPRMSVAIGLALRSVI